jgi:S-adenosylhomocysteine hydrolase
MNTVTDIKDYVIADINLADFGRKEIAIAERRSHYWLITHDHSNSCSY